MSANKYDYSPINEETYKNIKNMLMTTKDTCSNILTEKEFYCLLSFFRCCEELYDTDIFTYTNISDPIRKKSNIDENLVFMGYDRKKYFKLHSKYSPFPKSLIKKFESVGEIYSEYGSYYKDYYIDYYNLLCFLTNNRIVTSNTYCDQEFINDLIEKGKIKVQYVGEGGQFYESIHDMYESKNNGRQTKAYREFEESVLKRDGFECQICGSKINPQVHHILPYKTHVKLRTYINNGITLCEIHHSPMVVGGFHNKYGTYNNTPEQLQEYCNIVRRDLGLDKKQIINEMTERKSK